MLDVDGGANPSFIASQMGHEDARMVYEVYSKWIGDMNQDQVNMLNNQMPTALPQDAPTGALKKSFNFIALLSIHIISVKLFIPLFREKR
jgi:integrase